MFPTTQVNPTDLAAALQNSQVNETPAGEGAQFIKFDFKSGKFTYGRSHDEITGEQLVVNTGSIKHGWTLWVNNKPIKKAVPFNQPLPEPMPPEQGKEPSESRHFEARFLDEDVTLAFDINSFGGRKGVDALLAEIKMKALKAPEFLYPIVELTSESYQHKDNGNTIHNPVFKVVGWMDVNGNQEEVAAKIEAPKEEAPKEEAAPTRRRRRSA